MSNRSQSAPFAGVDERHGPAIPNGSVWENLHTYLVQWTGDSADGERCWMLLSHCYKPYHVDGSGGSAFMPVSNHEGRTRFTQEELAALIEERDLIRIDKHFEDVNARR